MIELADWTSDTPDVFNIALLSLIPPERVYEELSRRTKLFLAKSASWDPDLENVLLLRNEPLIDLALARFAKSEDVVTFLYKKGSKLLAVDNKQGAALRAGCIINTSRGWKNWAPYVFDQLSDASFKELAMLVKNPSIPKSTLAFLYRREKIFSTQNYDEWKALVYASAQNSAILINRTTSDQFDDYYHDMQRALAELPAKLEVNTSTAETVMTLYKSIYPPSGIENLALQGQRRWQTVEQSGQLTSDSLYGKHLNSLNELRLTFASLYGFVKDDALMDGDLTAPEALCRAAAYGRQLLTSEQAKAGFLRDGYVFTLCATNNYSVMEYDQPYGLRADLASKWSGWTKERMIAKIDEARKRRSDRQQ